MQFQLGSQRRIAKPSDIFLLMYSKDKNDPRKKNLNRNFYDDFKVEWQYYWANSMFLRWIESKYGEGKFRVFREIEKANYWLKQKE